MKHDAMSFWSPSSCCPGPESNGLTSRKTQTDIDEELILIAKAVGHATRVMIMKLLRTPTYCGELNVNVDLVAINHIGIFEGAKKLLD